MSNSDPPSRNVRYLEIADCTWESPGKCEHAHCRYSLLNERPHIAQWEAADFYDLVDALPATCALDLADLGGMRLEEVAVVMGLPKPKIEQIEVVAMRKLAMSRDIRKSRWDGR